MSGVLSTLFGIGPRTTTQANTPTMPGSTQGAVDELISRTRGFAAEPFQPYVDQYGRAIPRVAEFTPDQQRAFESTRNLATQAGGLNALTPELTQQAVQATTGMAKTLPEADLSGYMSPYTQAVLDPAIRAIEERAAKERLALGQQSARTGSFGGSRQAIAESELGRSTQRNIAETTATERAKAYNQALDQFRKDQAMIPSLYSTAQGQLGTGLQQTQGAFGSMVNPLLQTGGLQQAREQANLDVLRQQYEEERDFPLRGINALRQTLGINPTVLGVGSNQRSTQPGNNPLSAITQAVTGGPKFLENLRLLGKELGLYNPAAGTANLSNTATTQQYIQSGGQGPYVSSSGVPQ